MAKSLAGEWTVCAETLARAFWPGPLSIVVKAAATVPAEVTAGLDTVAIRMPNHGAALSLIAKTGPIAAPSANASGKPSPVIAAHVMEDLEGRIPLILDGGPCEFGVESTVVDAQGTMPVILRPGAVTIEMIRGVCGGCEIADGVFSPAPERAASPGMLHTHYAPLGRATLIAPHEGMADTLGALFDAAQSQGFRPVILCAGSWANALGSRAMIRLDDDGDMAHGLFRALRHADRGGFDRLFIEGVETEGTGMAYMNRALRAAGFDMYKGRERGTV
jgi:L-threonylcarbamoyladenylate synthase